MDYYDLALRAVRGGSWNDFRELVSDEVRRLESLLYYAVKSGENVPASFAEARFQLDFALQNLQVEDVVPSAVDHGDEDATLAERMEKVEAALGVEVARRKSEDSQMRGVIEDRWSSLASRVKALEDTSAPSDYVIATEVKKDRDTVNENFKAIQREVEHLSDLIAEHERIIEQVKASAEGPRNVNLTLDGIKINGKFLRIEEDEE